MSKENYMLTLNAYFIVLGCFGLKRFPLRINTFIQTLQFRKS